MNPCDTPRWVAGTPTRPGTAIALVTPGHDLDRHARGQAGVDLLATAAEDERVTALEPYDGPAGERVLDQQGVDGLLRGEPAARDLAHVDDLDVFREPVQRGQRSQAVDHDDVGRGQPLQAAHRHQAWIPRATADESRPGRAARRRDGCAEPARPAAPRPRHRPRCRVAPPPAVGLDPHAPQRLPVRTGRWRASRRWPSAASSARRHQIRLASASASTAALTSASAVQAIASQASCRSPSAYGRCCHSSRPRAARSASAVSTSGATSVTSAPASSRALTRRRPTGPPPTTTTRRPVTRSPSGRTGPSPLMRTTRPGAGGRGGTCGYRNPVARPLAVTGAGAEEETSERAVRGPSGAARPRGRGASFGPGPSRRRHQAAGHRGGELRSRGDRFGNRGGGPAGPVGRVGDLAQRQPGRVPAHSA